MIPRVRFVVMVGIDGSGKTTQAKLLVDALRQQGVRVTYVWSRWEPRFLLPAIMILRYLTSLRSKPGERFGQEMEEKQLRTKTGLKKKIFGLPGVKSLWCYLALADYYFQVRTRLFPGLQSEEVVVCDRYLYDAIVDLAANFETGPEGVRRLLAKAIVRLFPQPGVGIYVEVPAEVGYQRKSDGTPLTYLQKRQELYAAVATVVGMHRVDGTLPTATIHSQILSLVEATR